MVKTVRGTVELETLRDRLTEHCQKLPSFRKVESDTIEVVFGDHIRLELRERQSTKEKCWHCEGTGKDYDYDYENGRKVPNDDTCPMCDGTGERDVFHTTSAYLVAKEYPKSGAKVAIQVNTEGKKLEVWKPAVERIKTFLEELVGEPFVQVRLTKAEEVASRPSIMEMLEKTVKGENGGTGL